MSGLHEAVAHAIADALRPWGDDPGREARRREAQAAVEAVGVVLAEATRAIEALGTEWSHVRAGVTTYELARAADFKREALAALAALAEDEA